MLPAEARFCLSCGAPQRLRDAGEDDPVPEPEPVVYDSAVCSIGVWRGYLKAEFVAIVLDPGEAPREVGRSRPFRWRQEEPPPADRVDVREAFDALVAGLVEAGWEPVGSATPWYAQRFRRVAEGVHQLPRRHGAVPDETSTLSTAG